MTARETPWLWPVLGAIVLFVGSLGAWLLVRPASPSIITGVDGAAQVLAPLLGLALCRWNGGRRRTLPLLPRRATSPRAWIPLLVCLGLGGEALGQSLVLISALVLHQNATGPTWADAALLSSYLPFLLAIPLLPERPLSGTTRTRVLLDGLVIVAALATCSWSIILGPTLLQIHLTTAAKLVDAAYPLCDLLLLSCLLLLWMHADDWAVRPAMILFTLAAVSIVVSDSIYEYQSLHGGMAPGRLVDVGPPLGELLLALGISVFRRAISRPMAAPASDETTTPTPPRLWRSLLPYVLLPLTGLLIIYVWHSGGDPRILVGSMIGSGSLVAVVVLRQIVALVDNNRLFAALHESERRLRMVVGSTPVILFALDHKGRITLAEGAGIDALGLTARELPGRSVFEFYQDLPQVRESISRALAGEAFTARSEIGNVVLETRFTPLRDEHGTNVGVLGVSVDITERKRAEEALRHQALHDALTGLPNRTLLLDRLHQAIAYTLRERAPLALLLIDLDRFKDVNDTLGHEYGDVLLRELGQRMGGVLRASDTLARLGGDEFAVLLPGCDDTGAHRLAEALRVAIAAPVPLGGQSVTVGASIGIALCPAHGADTATLLRHADVAMYTVKRAGGGAALYSPRQDLHSRDRLNLAGALHQAVTQGELRLHYQPIAEAETNQIRMVEALVRWRHPDQGLLMPDQFIELAEQTGLIIPLTRWVLETAVSQCRAWHDAGLELGVTVNLSVRTLHDPDLPDTIAATLRRHDVAAHWLRVEVTESMVMTDTERATRVLTRLRQMGVRIAIDDFGTGFSSLTYLKRLPVDEIKIDRSFVMNMLADDDDATIVASTIGLGHSLGLRFVAEGVETDGTRDALIALGCDAMQGFYIGYPVAADELTPRLQAARAAA